MDENEKAEPQDDNQGVDATYLIRVTLRNLGDTKPPAIGDVDGAMGHAFTQMTRAGAIITSRTERVDR